MRFKILLIIGMLAAGIAVIFTAGRTDFFLSGPTPAERIAATVDASPAEEDPSALDVSLADVRAENSHADSPAATDAGKARKRLDLAEVQAALRALDDAPRGADTERRERELVDRWSELDPAGAAAYAAEVFQQGGSEGIFRRAAQAFARHNPATASAWAAALGAPMLRDTALREIYRTWSESDPMAAAASIGLLPIGSAQSIAATLVGSRLAEQNLATALQWVSQLGGSTQAASMRGAVSKWATSDPSAAAAWISRQTSPALRREGMQLLAQDWVGRDPAGALAYGQSIENADLRESFMRSAISRYGRNDPLAAAAWIATPEAAPYAAQAVREIGSQWAGFDPASAASWASSIGDNGMRNRAVSAVAKSWASSSPAQAAAWIQTLMDPSIRNAAAAEFSAGIARTDPATAAQWASAITDEQTRSRAVTDVVRIWKKIDASAAAAFVQSATALPEALRQRLLR